MEEDDGAIRSVPQILDHPIQVQAELLRVPVAVLLALDEGLLQDPGVVTPGRGAVVHSTSRQEALEEFRSDSQRPSSGQRLDLSVCNRNSVGGNGVEAKVIEAGGWNDL